MYTITTDAEFSAALDYLPVAVRAAHRSPGNDLLWNESVRAQRAVIEYADTRLDEADAAEVQALAGTIGNIAEWSDEYARLHGAEWSERSKSRIRALLAAHPA